ncbi:sugar phosphate isomerase/epimerase [Mesorhizobium sp. BAC0120]|uniref:sugar phosphate isomerase/epimerase family protein n=1 Tax=Mesorhizobium sp. BAC0120 TaxID=3090670 RepID=UPI00298D0E00|nr:sugar phosphate isomerase/epimerase [Mesorhizobium sp. BAC0120]MDW6025688.1 sugar phosphate isomerase/epimerase [Mesorhizobium sp. BAC0120]
MAQAWSFQLYSARNYQPWDKVLQTLGQIGYSQVEGFGGVYDDPAAFRKELDKNGLAMASGHFAIDLLENDFDSAARIAETLGVKLIACPFLMADDRPTDVDGWKGFGERLAKVGEKAKKAGFGFAWHNHAFEFEKLADGSVPQTHILETAPDIGWEMDVAWVIRGGADPLQWIDRYGKRIAAVHVKDIAPTGENADEDGWADVGHGTVDWKGLMKALREKTPARIFVMEHDNPSDYQRFARRSFDTVSHF